MKTELNAITNLVKATKSLILSIQAHPDYTGEENEEWTDLTSIAIDSCHDAEEAIKAIAESEAAKWHYLPELPVAYETGKWDGKRSDFVLVECSYLNFRVARIYHGTLDGFEFTDWYDEYDNDIPFVPIRWRELPTAYRAEKGGETE